MNQYFLYDPNVGITYFATEEACFHAAKDAIRLYCLECDGRWPEEELAGLSMGRVTHTAQQTHVVPKPPDDQLDDEGYDADGIEWTEHDYYCDYEMLPVDEFVAPEDTRRKG